MPFPADVSVAIVSHNSRETLDATLMSLARSGCPSSAIHVIDAASTDGTSEWVGAAHPGVRVDRLPRNDGPNPARNLAIRSSGRPFVFLMDADVQVEPEAIQRLRAALDENPRVKIAVPLVVYADAPDRIQYAGGRLHFICEAINPWLNRPVADRGSEPKPVGVASGNGLLIDCDAAVRIGLFDERYFLGKDDGEFTHRARIAGYEILEVPPARVLHQGRSRGTGLFYYQVRNRWHFMLKNYQASTLMLIAPCLLVHEPLQMLLLHAQGHGASYWRAVGGLIAMLPALPRDRANIRRIRRVDDAALLQSDDLVVRDDLLKRPIARRLKSGYDRFLRAYWRLLTTTVLTPAAHVRQESR